jgi:hypothetical protein
MGLDPAEFEQRRRGGATGTASTTVGDSLLAPIDRLLKAVAGGVKPEEVAAWQQAQLEEGRRRLKAREPLTLTQSQLLGAEATRIVPTDEERAAFERARRPAGVTLGALERIMRTTPPTPAPAGRTGAMKMISSALDVGGTR